MFGGLTKTSSRIAIAAALGMTLGGFAMSATPAKAADLGGDCCADLEERVAELEATTVRKGNKKVSVTLSGWVVKYGAWWDDGVEQNWYVGDKHTTLSSHFQISGSATIAPGWSSGYTIAVETRGGSTVGDANQFNDDTSVGPSPVAGDITGNISVLLSYMWLKSDRWGTVNWGQLSQATDNVALLPDLSGTIIESNAVLFDGAAFFLRANGSPRNSQGLSPALVWNTYTNCLEGGGGIGADCNGYPQNGVRFDSPTWGGFSVSSSYTEDDIWDVAVKYAADWNSVKFSAAAGFTQSTDEGCQNNAAVAGCTRAGFLGGGGAPFQGFRTDVDLFQVGASIMHVPSGLFAYGLYQHEENEGTSVDFVKGFTGNQFSANVNDTDVWYVKAGIKKAWMPAGATVLFGEWGQYQDQFLGGQILCSTGIVTDPILGPSVVQADATAGGTACRNNANVAVTSSTVDRWGLGVVQEIDSAAMHLWVNWQHLSLDTSAVGDGFGLTGLGTGNFKRVNQDWEDLDMFMAGGVIFF